MDLPLHKSLRITLKGTSCPSLKPVNAGGTEQFLAGLERVTAVKAARIFNAGSQITQPQPFDRGNPPARRPDKVEDSIQDDG